jgi:hypothetical protein
MLSTTKQQRGMKVKTYKNKTNDKYDSRLVLSTKYIYLYLNPFFYTANPVPSFSPKILTNFRFYSLLSSGVPSFPSSRDNLPTYPLPSISCTPDYPGRTHAYPIEQSLLMPAWLASPLGLRFCCCVSCRIKPSDPTLSAHQSRSADMLSPLPCGPRSPYRSLYAVHRTPPLCPYCIW